MPKTTAPIIFLLGTSTAGKSTICEEIVSKDLDNFETWGVDKEFNNEVNRCREILKDDARFLAIEEKFPHVWKIFAGIHLNEIKDATTGELLNFGDESMGGIRARGVAGVAPPPVCACDLYMNRL